MFTLSVARARNGAVAFAAVAALLTGAAPLHAGATERLKASDRQAIEQTIRLQIDAFRHDDADRAFAFATPDIQRLFGSSDHFLEAVRDQYEAVYRPASIRFERIALVDGDWVQSAQITDSEGRVWRALFTMRRQADRSWKVGGCQLVETSALET